MKKVYQYEVGILLDKDNEEFEDYSTVYDKKHGYYNEDWGVELTLEKAKEYVKDYVDDGVDKTYGIVSELEISDEEYEEILEDIENNGYYDTSNFVLEYSLDIVCYSLYKDKENIIENFINKGGK